MVEGKGVGHAREHYLHSLHCNTAEFASYGPAKQSLIDQVANRTPTSITMATCQ